MRSTQLIASIDSFSIQCYEFLCSFTLMWLYAPCTHLTFRISRICVFSLYCSEQLLAVHTQARTQCALCAHRVMRATCVFGTIPMMERCDCVCVREKPSITLTFDMLSRLRMGTLSTDSATNAIFFIFFYVLYFKEKILFENNEFHTRTRTRN